MVPRILRRWASLELKFKKDKTLPKLYDIVNAELILNWFYRCISLKDMSQGDLIGSRFFWLHVSRPITCHRIYPFEIT